MPVSHEHQAIYVHIPKTAGTSIEQALGICGSDNRGSLNKDSRIFFGRESIISLRPPILGCRTLQHYSLEQIISKIGPDKGSKYFKFSFVRNPYDRAVSDWFHMKRVSGKNFSFSEYFTHFVKKSRSRKLISRLYDDHFLPQCDFISPKSGTVALDFLGRYERISEDWKKISDKLNINLRLGHAMRSNHMSYHNYYDPSTRRMCEKFFGKDIDMFGYRFD